MKSVSEVMWIGRTFEESIQKALHMVDPSNPGFQPTMRFTPEELKQEMGVPTDKGFFVIAQALHDETMTVKEIHDITTIDLWFLCQLFDIVQTWRKMETVAIQDMTKDLMTEAKKWDTLRKTVTAMDVVYALKRQGKTLYGFGT